MLPASADEGPFIGQAEWTAKGGMGMRLSGKVALVTGASRGIGLGIVERFAEEGAVVYAGSTSNPDGVCPPGVTGLTLDVASEADWKGAVSRIVAEQGRIDVLVNNAGIIVYDPVHTLSLDDWNKVVAVNQTGVFLGMREVIPHMRGAKAGSIINVSSIWGNAAVAGAMSTTPPRAL
jgi:3alpha(or 20beta)-hydroxysteroid dehydrogenase